MVNDFIDGEDFFNLMRFSAFWWALEVRCKCKICGRFHRCPDDCAEHFKGKGCVCVDCFGARRLN